MFLMQFGSALCQLSCLSLFTSLVISEFGFDGSIVIPFTIVFALAYLLCFMLRERGLFVRILGVLPVIPLFFFCDGAAQYVFTAIPAIFILVIAIVNKYVIWYESFRRLFIPMLAFSIVVLLFAVVVNSAVDEKAITAPLTLIVACVGVLTLRMYRQDASVRSTPAFMAFNTISFAVLFAVTFIFGNRMVLNAIFEAIKWMGGIVIKPFSYVIAAVMRLFMKDSGEQNFVPPAYPDMEQPIPTEQPELPKFNIPETAEQISFIIGLLIGLAGLAVLIYIIVKFSGGHEERNESGRELERHERLDTKTGRGTTSTADIGRNAAGIRRIYRRLIRHLIKVKINLYPSDTSLDILERTEPFYETDPHARLRNIYLKVRYRTGYSPTAEDIDRARLAYRELISSPKNPLATEKRSDGIDTDQGATFQSADKC